MAITVALSTELSKTRTVTISSGSGTIGISITDPVSGAVTSVTVVWGTDDNTTATALATAINAKAEIKDFIAAGTATAGVFTLTYSGPVGLACPLAVAGSGSGLTVSGAKLGIYENGQKIVVTLPCVSTESVDRTITSIEDATGLVGVVDNSIGLVGKTLTANATTTLTFDAYLRTGQSDHLDITLDYRVIAGTVVGTTTTTVASMGPPKMVGGAFPSDTT